MAVITNLKPAKLAGHLSEAMILASEHAAPGGARTVKLIMPPSNASPGARIWLSGEASPAEASPQINSKTWDALKSGLAASKGFAAFKGVAWVAGENGDAVRVAPGVPDGAPIA